MIQLKGKCGKIEFLIRPFKYGDEKSLAKSGNNRKIWINLVDSFPYPYTLEKAKEWIELNQDPEKQKRTFAIEIDGKVAGSIGFGLQSGNEYRTAEIGYWLSEKYWGKGIATEALRIVTRYAFNNFNLERIQAKVYDYNPASGRVLEKAGFIYEGTLRNNTIKDGKITSERVYSILKEEFEEKY